MATEWNNELMEEIDIDTVKLIDAIQADGPLVFHDNYGDGVALADNVSFPTWTKLAEHYGLNVRNFINDY